MLIIILFLVLLIVLQIKHIPNVPGSVAVEDGRVVDVVGTGVDVNKVVDAGVAAKNI